MQTEVNEMSSLKKKKVTSLILTECPKYCFVQDTTHKSTTESDWLP